MTSLHTIREVHVATVRAALPEPIRFGDWVMHHREFCLVRLRADSGHEGFAFTLTREGPVAAVIKQAVARQYIGSTVSGVDDVGTLFRSCQSSNLAGLSSGIGLRALSIVDIAAHDLAARASGLPIANYLGGGARPLPVTAIIGYPPASMPPDAVEAQVLELKRAGWRRFKIPIALPLELGAERAIAARQAAGEDAWLGMDAAWLFRDVAAAVSFLEMLEPARLSWFEDVFPPGDAALVAALRRRTEVPIAMGDEQGGSYYPEALLAAKAVDVIRIDATCMGGLTRFAELINACRTAGVAFAPHMFAHVHSQIVAGLGYDAPIEWGVPDTGVDQFADSLRRPVVRDGLMVPLEPEPGFGPLINPDWLAAQDVDDVDGLVRSLS